MQLQVAQLFKAGLAPSSLFSDCCPEDTYSSRKCSMVHPYVSLVLSDLPNWTFGLDERHIKGIQEENSRTNIN